MQHKRQVYLLDQKSLTPETIAVTFAKTSRSPKSFAEIAEELSDSQSAEFHEKWVVGYGHSSVAEHAMLHIAIENISRLAVEHLESNRLASYTEKSTRYQQWGSTSFHVPTELKNQKLKEMFANTCQRLFETYTTSLPAIKAIVENEFPRKTGESSEAWESRLRSKYIDACRFLLPSSSLANVGMTINARNLEHLLRKMLSQPLLEVRDLAKEIKSISVEKIPTLIKYIDEVPYLQQCNNDLNDFLTKLPDLKPNSDEDWCKLVSYDLQGEERILASALYKKSDMDYYQLLNFIQKANQKTRDELAGIILQNLTSHDIPIRELEHTNYSFEITLDQGAYFELKRHRMMTQSPQILSANQGYTIPSLFSKAGLESMYCEAMDAAAQTYRVLAEEYPDAASYIIPNGFNRSVLLSLNLRTAFHLISLRTAPNAHFSIRRVALRMAEKIRSCTPLLGHFLKINSEETWEDLEQKHFTQV